ncbi:MAG TPA: TetR/AcrR family transcriptional regulator [Nocardioides sp.]|nr:TetR/AcrR family transcriptional regulator [Nocardioides sp.]
MRAIEQPSTRERILAAAAQTLTTKGYAKAHLTEIARVARLQPPAVYHYFSSRDDLVGAVMREGQLIVRRTVEAALAALPADAGIGDRLAAAVDAHLRVELELSDFATAVTRNAGQLPPSVRGELAAESREYHDVWRSLLQQAEHAGCLHPDLDVHAGRMLVIGALNWATEWRRASTPVDDVVKAAQTFVLGGLLATSLSGSDLNPRG